MRLKLSFYMVLILLFSCEKSSPEISKKYEWKNIRVTASAYNSTKAQTDSNPYITAWGDSLKPGLKYIAVSNDLLRKGMKHNTPVRIEGFKGLYLVKDRMHPKWKNKIDIYMGVDIRAARNWGRKKVTIDYRIEIDSTKK